MRTEKGPTFIAVITTGSLCMMVRTKTVIKYAFLMREWNENFPDSSEYRPVAVHWTCHRLATAKEGIPPAIIMWPTLHVSTWHCVFYTRSSECNIVSKKLDGSTLLASTRKIPLIILTEKVKVGCSAPMRITFVGVLVHHTMCTLVYAVETWHSRPSNRHHQINSPHYPLNYGPNRHCTWDSSEDKPQPHTDNTGLECASHSWLFMGRQSISQQKKQSGRSPNSILWTELIFSCCSRSKTSDSGLHIRL